MNDRYIFALGGKWQDNEGTAVLLTTVNAKRKGEFAVMQRLTPKITNPFVVSTRELLRGLDGWKRIYPDAPII